MASRTATTADTCPYRGECLAVRSEVSTGVRGGRDIGRRGGGNGDFGEHMTGSLREGDGGHPSYADAHRKQE